MQTDNKSAVALLVMPLKDLLVVMHKHALESIRAGTKDLALCRLGEEVL